MKLNDLNIKNITWGEKSHGDIRMFKLYWL